MNKLMDVLCMVFALGCLLYLFAITGPAAGDVPQVAHGRFAIGCPHPVAACYAARR